MAEVLVLVDHVDGQVRKVTAELLTLARSLGTPSAVFVGSNIDAARPRLAQFGAMLEVPSLLFDLDGLMEKVDFVSIGSNDLFQFMYAADRGNSRVADRFETLSPTFLRALKSIADAAARHETPLTLCGEIAGRPLEALALAALGITTLSMSPAAIGPVKAAILKTDMAALRAAIADPLENGSTGADIRDIIREYAEAHAIAL